MHDTFSVAETKPAKTSNHCDAASAMPAELSTELGPTQTTHLVVDNYLLSTTNCVPYEHSTHWSLVVDS